MKAIKYVLLVGLAAAMCTPLSAAPLISAKEAALPPAAGALATRGISRGPAVKLISPESDTPVQSPFDFKVSLDARGGQKIDPDSVKVVYMKAPFVDLTPRLK